MISRRHFFRFLTGLGAFSASAAAYGFGIEPELLLRVTRYNLAPPQWPAGFQLKIAAVADLHACDPWMSLDRIDAIVQQTNRLGADLIVLLGDYVAGHRHVTRFIPAAEWAAVLGRLKAPLGVHAILGNHDWWEDKTVQAEGRGPTRSRVALEAAGIPVYENDVVRLTKDGQPFWLAGLGDQLFVRTKVAKHRDQCVPFIRRIADAKAFLDLVGDSATCEILASGFRVLVLFLELRLPKFESDLV